MHVTPSSVNKTKARAINIKFDNAYTSSIRSQLLDIQIWIIEFHLVETNTFFLIYIEDIDKLNIYFNKLNTYDLSFWSPIFAPG